MNLTARLDKLKQGGKRAALALTLGSSLLYNSGCALPAAAFIHGVAINSAAETQAQAIRDAARMQTQANQPQVNQPQVTYIPRQNRFFAAESYKGDLNGNGAFEFEEYDGVGDEFESGKPFSFGAEIFNRGGAELETKFYKIEPDGKKLFHSTKSNIPGSTWCYTLKFSFDKGLSEGIYSCNYKIENETIGSTLIEVKSKFVNTYEFFNK